MWYYEKNCPFQNFQTWFPLIDFRRLFSLTVYHLDQSTPIHNLASYRLYSGHDIISYKDWVWNPLQTVLRSKNIKNLLHAREYNEQFLGARDDVLVCFEFVCKGVGIFAVDFSRLVANSRLIPVVYLEV